MIDEFGNRFRVNVFLILISIIFLGLTARLVELQIIDNDEYGLRSEHNSVKRIPHEPGRGSIFDRNKKLLVDTRPAFSLFITPNEFDESLIPIMSKALNLDTTFIQEKLQRGRNYSKFVRFKIKREIDFQTISFFEENHDKFPGVEIDYEPKRTYFSNAKMSHFLGYIKEISDDQISKDTGYYAPGDYIGRDGIESSYEDKLRGVKGWNYLLVNSQMKKIGKYLDGKKDKLPVDGSDLILSIDSDLQLLAESLIGNRKGSVVAMDPQTGEILCLASKPDFDLNIFSGITKPEVMDSLLNSPDKPFNNRATQGIYPPGSTFKMVLAAACLQEGIIDQRWTVNCGGSFQYGDQTFKCTHVHGAVNVTKAIHQSCNIFFYNLMLKLQKEKGWSYWSQCANYFGFGKKTGIDISEKAGLIPTESYYKKMYGKSWGTGFLISLAIGQGEVSVTPLQMAAYCSSIANYGKFYTPRMVHSYVDKQTQKETALSSNFRQIPISKDVFDIIRNGMLLAVNSGGGTGLAAAVPGIQVAGKTGTAQNPHGNNHAWFIGFAPYDNPKIAVAVIIENGGFGGSSSAPIAGALIKQYLLNSNKSLDGKQIETVASELNKASVDIKD